MGSIVQELQMDAMSSSSNISDLLRKSLVVARKLKITEFERWVIQELNGFKVPLKEIPEYRKIVGKIQWFNSYRGWCPVIIENEEILDMVSKNKIAQPITEIEDLVKSTSDYLVILIPQGQQNLLSELLNETTEFRLVFGKSQAQRIIDTVRNIILEWALKLEEDGILGEKLSFSNEEKQVASQHEYPVNNFYGNVSGLQIQQHTSQSTQTMINEIDLEKVNSLISTLKENINQIGLQAESQKVLESEIVNITTQIESKQPKSSIIQQSLKSIRNVLEGVTGSLIASGILYQLNQLGM